MNNMKLSFQTALTNFFSLKNSLVCTGKVHIHITYLRNRKKLLEFYRQNRKPDTENTIALALNCSEDFHCVLTQRA